MKDVARVIHLEVSFSAAVPADAVSTLKDRLHKMAEWLTEGMEDKSIMSLIAVAEENTKHLVRHLT